MHKLTLDSTPQASTQTATPPVADAALTAEPTKAKPFGAPPADTSPGKVGLPVVIGVCVVVLVAGAATGLGAFQLSAKNTGSADNPQPMQQVAGNSVSDGDVFGSPDADSFKDVAEGYLEMGGIGGEGSHKLLRPGGDSQTVYLTSSVTDLDKLAGMQVKVWGETFKGQEAGWLMDVGRVQVVDSNAQKPE